MDYNNIKIHESDISDFYTIFEVLNYGDRDIYILHGLEKYYDNFYYIAFYDDIYSMYAVMRMFDTDVQKIIDNGFREEDVLEEMDQISFLRQYFTQFSEARKKYE